MKRTMKKFGLALILLMFVVSTSGCFALLLGAAAGAGGVAWVQGALETNYDVSIEKVYNASKKGLKRLKLLIIQDQKDKHNAKLVAEYPDGKKATLDIKALTERASQIKIRVGVFGDRTRSEAILAAIQRYL